jgi:hypothetical protein
LALLAPPARALRRSGAEAFLRTFCLMGQKPLASLERGCKYPVV